MKSFKANTICVVSILLLFLLVMVGMARHRMRQGKAEDHRFEKTDGIVWYDACLFAVEGQGWPEFELEDSFDRLPLKAKGVVRNPVWNLGKFSAGLCVRFRTDTSAIHARWILSQPQLQKPHMPATGVSGLDLYVKDDQEEWKWLATGMPEALENQVELIRELPVQMREYCLYLPLYNGVKEVYLGISKEARCESSPRSEGQSQAILFYGSSITQGASASRCGMTYPAILGRRLNRPVLNLGFSGNGKMEEDVVELLAELDPVIYVIDCLPNMKEDEVTRHVKPLVMRLRQARPRTPIVLAEDRAYGYAFLVSSARQRNETNRAALRKVFDELVNEGIPELYYLPGETQLGEDNLATVDGSHPTDLGFMRMADAFEKVLAPILKTLEESQT